MIRLKTFTSIDTAPEAARAGLEAVSRQLGSVPNLFRVVANSPAALGGLLGLEGAASKGRLGARTLERIALAVAEINACGYCLSAHTYIARNLAKLDDAEITANRSGASNDPQAAAAVAFAVQVAQARGHVSDAQVADVRAAGFDDAQIVEIVQAVVLNTYTNYINEVARTQIDFPAVEPLRKSA
jgi:uncharacterized peroxidase-related enzyme